MGAGRADIDANRHQRDIVLTPERIVLKRPFVVEIVIVVGIVAVPMYDVSAIEMVGERMARLVFFVFFLFFVVGHSGFSLRREGLNLAAIVAGQ